jgi:hypothetical protein
VATAHGPGPYGPRGPSKPLPGSGKGAPRSTPGDAVTPGTATSPIPHLKTPGAKNVKVGGMHVGTVNVDALRQFLIHKGYDLPHEGGLGPKMKSALADFINPAHVGDALSGALKGTNITGARNPQAWNKRFGGTETKSKSYRPATGPGGALDANGNDVTGQYAGADTVNVAGLTGLGPDTVGTTLPTTLAAKLADLKYGADIKDAEASVARQPGQAAQDLHDIENWYGQVTGAQKTAAGRDSAITKAGVGSIRDAVARIVSSLGGSANSGIRRRRRGRR